MSKTIDVLAALAALLVVSSESTAAAADPPSGWEVAPRSPKEVVRPIDRCGDNADCHLRQTGLDAPRDATPWTTVEVNFAALPILSRREAKADAPLTDAPPVRVLDGLGRPFPWPDGAKGEIRVMPPGKLGEIAWGSEWPTPFFQDPKYRSMGYGESHAVEPRGDRPATGLTGRVEYVSIDRPSSDGRGEGRGLVYDHVVGKLDGAPQIAATLWEHADAAPLPSASNGSGFGHAFRDEGPSPSIVFLLPEVLLGIEGRRVKVWGGFVVESRFSSDQAFTRYTMPADASATGTATFTVVDTQRRRWLGTSDPAPKGPRAESFLVAVSRTSVEKAPRVIVWSRPRKPGI